MTDCELMEAYSLAFASGDFSEHERLERLLDIAWDKGCQAQADKGLTVRWESGD